MPPAPRSSGALRPKMRGESCNGFILQLQTDGVLAEKGSKDMKRLLTLSLMLMCLLFINS
jgi:hypothetical protein